MGPTLLQIAVGIVGRIVPEHVAIVGDNLEDGRLCSKVFGNGGIGASTVPSRQAQLVEHTILDDQVFTRQQIPAEEIQRSRTSLRRMRRILHHQPRARAPVQIMAPERLLQRKHVASHEVDTVECLRGRLEVDRDDLDIESVQGAKIAKQKGAASCLRADLENSTGLRIPDQAHVNRNIDRALLAQDVPIAIPHYPFLEVAELILRKESAEIPPHQPAASPGRCDLLVMGSRLDWWQGKRG